MIPAPQTRDSTRTTYWLTRFILLRLLGLVYFVAFLAAARQIVPLVGSNGLLPAAAYLRDVEAALGSTAAGFARVPTLFWIDVSDRSLLWVAWIGVGLSLVLLAGFANVILLVILWALYMSIVHVGQEWYAYGWEIQLLETGFLAMFLCPLLDPRPFSRRPPPAAVLWLFRWLICRIMLGAGLIKMRGDPCWLDLTCLDFHYLTQPIPNPLSRWFHFQPHAVHLSQVLYNHVAELGAGVLVMLPDRLRRVRRAAGLALFGFQVALILSGNLSFLNYLTIVPILACFDDAVLGRILPQRLTVAAGRAAAHAQPSVAQRVAVAVLVAVVAVRSVPVVVNLLSSRQAMNTSFDPLALVNTYGAFGSVGRERHEIVFEGTSDSVLTAGTVWREYEFPCKPGDVRRRPSIVAPYQPRLDWAIWFAAMATPNEYPWTLHLVWKLLHGDRSVLQLLATNPFPDAPPRWVRAQYYRYEFAPRGDPSGAWWRRELVGSWLPPLGAEDARLQRALAAHGWLASP